MTASTNIQDIYGTVYSRKLALCKYIAADWILTELTVLNLDHFRKHQSLLELRSVMMMMMILLLWSLFSIMV